MKATEKHTTAISNRAYEFQKQLDGLKLRLTLIEQVLADKPMVAQHERDLQGQLITARGNIDKLHEQLADKDGQRAEDTVSDLAAWQKICEDRVTANFREQLYATERELEFWKGTSQQADARVVRLAETNKQLREALSAMGQAATTVQDLLKERDDE